MSCFRLFNGLGQSTLRRLPSTKTSAPGFIQPIKFRALSLSTETDKRKKAAIVKATPIAKPFREHTRKLINDFGVSPKVIGFLGNNDPAAYQYAHFTKKTLEADGIEFDLVETSDVDIEKKVIQANQDSSVHGILVFYPIFGSRPSFFGGSHDEYIRDCISPEKDVEGMCNVYRQNLYRNIRCLTTYNPITDQNVIEAARAAGITRTLYERDESSKCLLPCTPLACVKILESLQIYDENLPVGNRMLCKTVTVINRSEVLGRPLGAMLANDGASVYSVDIDNLYVQSRGEMFETKKTLKEACLESHVIVTGVPDPNFNLDLSWIREGTVVINVATDSNVDKNGILEIPGVQYVPLVGKVTIAMLGRNLMRLYENFHHDKRI
uniref:Tetrahydrofolate dehydrogenase/cyclohydrolase NAD(P)-binding domain-containing protein n=1 Tax=Aplanochytrium stocchinoi TaxID=215587 RepID=A0A7S3PNL9_9STRA